MMNAPLVIVGAGHAGGRAALTLREEGYTGRLILIGDEAHLPYERPPLSKGLLQGTADLAGCSLFDGARLAELSIEHIASNPVTRLEPQHHRVQLADGQWLAYTGLLLATGGGRASGRRTTTTCCTCARTMKRWPCEPLCARVRDW